MNWSDFIESLKPRVRAVVEDGPMPYRDYDGKLSWLDKRMGMMVYKGGDGYRGTKRGQAAVVYFSPAFGVGVPDDVPDDVLSRHSDEKVRCVFDEL